MCVLYVCFGSTVIPRTFGCVAMCIIFRRVWSKQSASYLSGLDFV